MVLYGCDGYQSCFAIGFGGITNDLSMDCDLIESTVLSVEILL